MRKIALFFLLIVHVSLEAQIIQDFSENTFLQYTDWNGTKDQFQINAALQLQLNNNIADTSYLSFPIGEVDTAFEWKFWCKLSFKTSGSNYARFYLVADKSDLSLPLNGVFLAIGGTNDSLNLFVQENTQLTKLFTGKLTYTNNSINELFIRITKKNNLWELFSSTDGIVYMNEGTTLFNYSGAMTYSGFFCKYTSSNATKIYFDDLSVGAIIPDTIQPKIVNTTLEGDSILQIVFNEAIYGENALVLNNEKILDSSQFNITGSIVMIKLIDAYNEAIEFKLIGFTDPAGNVMTDTVLTILIPGLAKIGDIIINEILFNPIGDGVDFIELYNISETFIDLQKLYFASLNSFNQIKSIYPISDTRFILKPKEIIAITENTAVINLQYPHHCSLLTTKALPSLPNTEGTAMLINADSAVFDRFDYKESFHHALLADVEGYSLELIDPYLSTNNQHNWHSAADSYKATPGCANSQRHSNLEHNEIITVEPEIVSPNQDGYHDFLSIHVKLPEAGWMANINILNRNGQPLINLATNELLSTSEIITWDGLLESNKIAPSDLYIIYIELFNLNGQLKRFKKTCVISANN